MKKQIGLTNPKIERFYNELFAKEKEEMRQEEIKVANSVLKAFQPIKCDEEVQITEDSKIEENDAGEE